MTPRKRLMERRDRKRRSQLTKTKILRANRRGWRFIWWRLGF